MLNLKKQKSYLYFILFYFGTLFLCVTAFNLRWFDPLRNLNASLDYAPSISQGDDLSWFRHYYNLDGAVDVAMDADVIVFGNSRTLYGLSNFLDSNIRRKFNLKVFFLSQNQHFGGVGSYLYEFMKKYPLKNKLFILNVDHGFFNPSLPDAIRNEISKNRDEARKHVISANIKWQFLHLINAVTPIELPRIITIRKKNTEDWMFYSGKRKGRFEIKYHDKMTNISGKSKKFSKDLIALLQKNNNEVVYIGIPHHNVSYENVKYFSRFTNVPCYIEKISPLYTCDKSHLNTASAKKYSDWLTETLTPKLQEFKNKKL
eukprot:TRINITY_DN604578_c0_g5_i1.p2 TRINITY_DN604578_c0_g5~~TRINITY_DN604578_c0_g5_i1.p2  ORF type:complete len:316 (-),score=-4.89 TRINITY_DN604578_c0_g5_i1:173-1120(-)